MKNKSEKLKELLKNKNLLIIVPVVILLAVIITLVSCPTKTKNTQNETEKSTRNTFSSMTEAATTTSETTTTTTEAATTSTTVSTTATETGNLQTGTVPEKDSRPSGTTAGGPLKVDGNKLVNQNGTPIQLRGISTHGINWFPDYVNQELFTQFRQEWNADVIRLAMYTAEYNGYCTGGNQEELKNLVKKGVEYATNADLYVIIDWHTLSDSNPNTYVNQSKEFFAEMSSLYAHYDNVFYEICNEPNGGTSWAEVKKYALEVIPVIRANDPDGIILVGTPNWSQYVDQAAADPITGYDNIMYTLHFYAGTHTDSLRNTLTNAVNQGLPVFVSEYGICDASGNGSISTEQANKWVDTMNSLGVSYIAWNISNKNESSAIFQSSCKKISGITTEDLSDSGKWLYDVLRKQ